MTRNSNAQLFSLNLATNYLSAATSIVLGFVLPPLALSYWRVDSYGIWTLITSLVAYLSASGLGVETAAAVLMAKTNLAFEKWNIFKSSMFILVCTTMASGVIIIFIGYFLPNWFSIFGKIPVSLADESRRAVLVFVLAYLINYPFAVVGAGLAGYQRLYTENIFRTINSLVGLVSLLVTIKFHGNLIIYAIIQGCFTFVINCIKLIVFMLIVKKDKEAVIQISDQASNARDSNPVYILGIGIKLFLFGISALVINNIDNFIVSNYVGIFFVASFSLTSRLFLMMNNIVTLMIASGAPIISKEYGNKNWNWMIKTYELITVVSIFFGGGIFLGGLLFVNDFIAKIWVGPSGSSGQSVIFFIGLYSLAAVLVNANNIFLIQCNFTKSIIINGWTEVIAHVGIGLALAPRYGVLGIAVATSCSTIITQFWMAPWSLNRDSGGNLQYKWRMLVGFAVFAILPCAILAHINNLANITIGHKFINGIGIFVMYLLLSFVVLPRELVYTLLSKIQSWR